MKLFIPFLFVFLAFKATSQNYFQQEVNYDINVALDDKLHELNADITMEYTNNSPDALNFIWMHLWPNAYKNGKTALAKQQYRDGDLFMFYAMDKSLGYIDQLDFKVNGTTVKWEYHPKHIDIAKVMLNKPLLPGETIEINTPFHVKLPSGKISRLGHLNQSYQITQWYPKPAVYDNDGWHEMPYLNQGEFYSEFGSFDVKITLPKNYVVGATGDLKDCPEEVAFLNELDEKTRASNEIGGNEFPPSSDEMKTLRYVQQNVHDFAFFTDKRWRVLKDEVTLPRTGQTVTTWAMFTPQNALLWEKSPEYLNDAVKYYSKWNGDYPYNQVTAVDGTISAGGGMEYPNVTVIGNSGSALGLETVIVHEVGHNWFYGILGSNERDNAWMDEGINSFNETRYFRAKYMDTMTFASGIFDTSWQERLDMDMLSYRMRDEYAYLLSAKNGSDQPMQCHSDSLSSLNYGTIVYKKTAVAFDHLKGYLGDDVFDRAMNAYFEEWKFKHPGPDDLRKSLETSTGKDLSWFFEGLVKTDGRIDYAFAGASKSEVVVKNRGDLNVPFQLTFTKDGEVISEKWFDGLPAGDKKSIAIPTGATHVQLDGNETMLEYDRQNNQLKTSGLFKRVEPITFKFATRLDNPEKTEVFWIPAVAWNEQNNFMAGVNLHNTTLPGRDWEFSVTPLYSFSQNNINGFARVSKYFGKHTLDFQVQKFTYARLQNPFNSIFTTAEYIRPSVSFEFILQDAPRSRYKDKLNFEFAGAYSKSKNEFNDGLEDIFPDVRWSERFSPQLTYSATAETGPRVTHNLALTARAFLSALEINNASSALVSAAYSGEFSYNKKGKKIRWKGFAGKIFDEGFSSYSFSGNGRNGQNDIYFDHLFLQRFGPNEFLGRQIANDNESVLVNNIAYDWMANGMLEFEVPKTPFSIWFSGSVSEAKFINSEEFLGINYSYSYASGISFTLVRDVMAVHMPLINPQFVNATKYEPWDYLTFQFNIDKLNPWSAIRKIGQ